MIDFSARACRGVAERLIEFISYRIQLGNQARKRIDIARLIK